MSTIILDEYQKLFDLFLAYPRPMPITILICDKVDNIMVIESASMKYVIVTHSAFDIMMRQETAKTSDNVFGWHPFAFTPVMENDVLAARLIASNLLEAPRRELTKWHNGTE